MSKLIKTAWILTALPLVIGVGIFVAWLITRAIWLMYAGMLTIYAGLASVFLAIVCAVAAIIIAKMQKESPRRRISHHVLGVLFLVICNFVAAGACVVAAVVIQTRYTITVMNQSDQPLQDVRVFGGGVHAYLGDIPPGGTASDAFWIGSDGELVLTATHGSDNIDTIVDDYVTNGSGRDLHVTLDQAGTVTAD